MRNRNPTPCKEFSAFVWTTKIETSKLSSPAPAEAGIEISSHNYRAAGEISGSGAPGCGACCGSGSGGLGMDFL